MAGSTAGPNEKGRATRRLPETPGDMRPLPFFFFFATQHSLQDLSSPSRDQTRVHRSESAES